MGEKKKKESGRELAEEELKEVSGGRSASASCDKCTADEFPKEGACFGSWSDGSLFTCGSLLDSGRFLKCVRCGYKKSN